MREERQEHHGRGVDRDLQTDGDARAHALLEANIARLLKYAYVPALPSPEFRTRLIALARTEAVRQHRLRGGATRRAPARGWGAALALAATLLVCLGALRWFAGHSGARFWPGVSSSDVADIVADGRVAFCVTRPGAGGPDESAPWQALDVPAANSAIELGQGTGLRLRTPDDQHFATRFLAAGFELFSPTRRSDPEAPAQPHRVELKLAADTAVALRARESEANSTPDLWIEIERGALILGHQRGVLAEAAGFLNFDARGGSFQVTRTEAGLSLRCLEPGLVLTALDPSGLPLTAALTLAAEETARFEGGHLKGPQGLASTFAAEGQRTPQDAPEAALSDAKTGGATAASQLLVQVTTATGEPVPEVTLALVPPARQNRIPDPIVHASVAADGRHYFAEPPLGTYRPIVHAPGFGLWSGEWITIEKDRERQLDVTLTAGGVLRGFIVDQASGNPIAGARIVPRADAPAAALPFDLTQSDPWLPILAVSATDGSFELPHVSPGIHELHIAADGKAAHFEENVRVRAGAISEVAPIALVPEAVLAGRVWDADGSPSVGTQVVASPFQMGPEGLSLFALGTTDAEGAYSVGGLPAGRHFAISIPAQPDRAPDVRPFLAIPGKTTRIEFGRSAMDLFGAGSTGPQGTLVAGVLRDATGKGLAVANIALVEHGEQGDSGSSGSFRASSTSTDGSFRFEDVAAGDFDLMVVGANNSVSTVGQVHVEAGLAELRVDYQLGAATVSGQVLRAADLAPVQGATVVLLGFAPGTDQVRFLAESTTGADGTWQVQGLSSGGLFAVIYPQKEGATEAGPLGYARTPRVEIPPEQAEINLGTTALFLGGDVRVQVTDREGRAIEGLHLVITASNGAWAQPNPYLSTLSDGSLNLWGLAPGTYTVRAFPAQGAPQTSHFSVSAGEETSHHFVLD